VPTASVNQSGKSVVATKKPAVGAKPKAAHTKFKIKIKHFKRRNAEYWIRFGPLHATGTNRTQK